MRIRGLFSLLAISTLGILSLFPAEAMRGSSRADARETVGRIEARHEQLLAQAPRLAEIDSVIREDCAAKSVSAASDGPFCRCAAASTMDLWLSGIDPRMASRLTEFANGRGEATARTFLDFQGPELYRPLCTAAGRR